MAPARATPTTSTNMQTITYPLKLTKEEHATIKRRAAAADLSIQKFVKYMAIDGSLPKTKKP